MFQSLLEERFGLTWRREPKEMQVYSVLVGKGMGRKLKEAQTPPGKQDFGNGNSTGR